MTTILVGDPDRHVRRVIAAALRFAGYAVETARDSQDVSAFLRRHRPDALIIDPAETGTVNTVTALRAQTDVPILVVSGAGDEWEKVATLDAGADDYLTKPFGTEELLARLRVVLRRLPRSDIDDAPIETADFTIHLSDRRWVGRDGSEVSLTPTEWRLVEILVRHPGRLVTQADLLQGVWGPSAVEKTHYLRVQMASIRRKVEPEPGQPRYFITAPGLGLRFNPSPGDRLQPC
jgi:two-component system KDP operon response regulator KdpE